MKPSRIGYVLGSALLLCTGVLGQAQTVVRGWEGVAGPNGTVPPDVHGAPGPEGVLAVVNLQLSYYTKAGAVTWGPVGCQAFWASAGITANGLSDPKAIFDPASRRFFVILQENTGSRFWLNVAVSRDSDPQTSDGTEWRFYRLDATELAAMNNAGGINYGGDYPGLAIDSRALYVTFRMYSFDGAGNLAGAGVNYFNTALLILDKNNLLNGAATLVSLYQPEFDLQPVTPYTLPAVGAAPDNVMYMVAQTSATNLRIVSVTDPLGARTVATRNLTIINRGTGVGAAPQAGSANTVPTIDRTLGNASLLDGDLWFCATVGTVTTPPAPPGRAVAAYYRARLNGWPLTANNPTLVEDSTVGNPNEWNFCPAIGMNSAGEVVITWTRSSAAIFPTIAYAYRGRLDGAFGAAQDIIPSATIPGPPGSPPIIVNNTANNDGRWGDYFSVWPDPNDGSLWIANEWTRTDTGTWSTWWAQVTTPAQDVYVNLNVDPVTQNGSAAFPWRTVGRGHTAITRGNIYIAPGRYNETLTLNKATTLSVTGNGQVVIGPN